MPETCPRCGRAGHVAIRCYYRTTADGTDIDDDIPSDLEDEPASPVYFALEGVPPFECVIQ